MEKGDDVASPWSLLPQVHPTLFDKILWLCSPKELLACRATCSTWRSWFSVSCRSVWARHLQHLVSRLATLRPEPLVAYRLDKLQLLSPPSSEREAMHKCLSLHRLSLNGETVPMLSP